MGIFKKTSTPPPHRHMSPHAASPLSPPRESSFVRARGNRGQSHKLRTTSSIRIAPIHGNPQLAVIIIIFRAPKRAWPPYFEGLKFLHFSYGFFGGLRGIQVRKLTPVVEKQIPIGSRLDGRIRGGTHTLQVISWWKKSTCLFVWAIYYKSLT